MSARADRGRLPPESLPRQLTVLGIWALAINGTVGAGIFGAPAGAAQQVGVYSPLLFVVCGVLLAPVVLTFCGVASSFRDTGGPVRYAEAAFGPMAGFQVGWAFYIARVSATAANIGMVVSTIGWFWPAADRGFVRPLLLFALCAALTWVNVVGTRHAMRSVGLLTILKFVPLLVLVAVGLARLDASVFASEDVPSIERIGAGLMLMIYAFVGWEAAVIPAGEARDPGRDMARGLLWSLAAATALYTLIQVVAVAALPTLAETQARPLVAVGEALLGPAGAALLTLGVIVSVGGNVASAAVTTPRITYAMARAGTLPAGLGRVHPRFLTPAVSILVYGVLSYVLTVSGTFFELAKISVLTRLLIYLTVIATVPRLGARVRGGIAVSLLAAGVCVGLLLQVDGATFLRTATCLAIGSLLYFVARRERR